MTTQTITARSSTLTGFYGGANYVNGSASVDDTTKAGKTAIEYAKRHGFAVSNGIAAAVAITVENGKPVSKWTAAECKTYLDARQVTYPSNAGVADLRNAVQTAYETRAQGGSAALPTAGHIMGTFPVEGAPIVPGDDAAKAAQWHTPVTGSASDPGGEIAPTISVQPVATSKVAPATATFTVTAAGTPTPSYQWQKDEAGGAVAWADIPGATGASYTTPATSVGADNGDKYRVVVSSEAGTVTSNEVALTVTAS